MTHRLASTVAYAGSVAAAALAAILMSGSARAEGPIEVLPPFAGTLSRAEVRAELMRDRARVSSYATEYALQRNESLYPTSGYTRAQARAEYIAARDEVHAMNSEDGGSTFLASAPKRFDGITVARTGQR